MTNCHSRRGWESARKIGEKRGKSGGQLKNDARPAGGNAFSK